MQFCKPEELKVGMRLAKPIYNRQGVLLYDRGSSLNAQIIDSIRRFGLIGVLTLGEAEPLPPVSPEELEFEQLQTTYMFRLRDSLVSISKGQNPEDFSVLVDDICKRFGTIAKKVAFSQTIRSSEDYNYKHSICCAILSAMTANSLGIPEASMKDLIAAALLADFGFLYVPKDIMNKYSEELTSIELLTIEQYRVKAFGLLQEEANPFGLTPETFDILKSVIKIPRKENPDFNTSEFNLNAKILMVTDKYDRMTAMSLNYTPVSGVIAIKHLQEVNELYDPMVVSALGKSIEILPTGQSVSLNNHGMGLILDENDADIFKPRILDLNSNEVYELGEAGSGNNVVVTDVLETFDRRYICDEETIKQFAPDEELVATTRRIKIRLANAKKREATSRSGRNRASRVIKGQ